ncbi:MAG TPA: SAM-dependent methyltransferase [Coriobacteriia bacterium]
MSCCTPSGYRTIFGAKTAEREARRYRRKGLAGTARWLAEALEGAGVTGRSVLEVGGGIGEIQLELLKAGATRAVNVELATQYETVASELIRAHGLEGSVERRLGDFVRQAHGIDPAEVVVLHRVVCCYPDADALVGSAADRARRLLVLTFPVDRWWIRWGVAAANALLALRGSTFRGYVHATDAVRSAAERHGLRTTQHRRGLIWQLLAFERMG